MRSVGSASRRARVGFFLAAALAMTVSTVPLSSTAHAYTPFGQGCRFDPDNDNDGLGVGIYAMYQTAAKTDSTRKAQSYWNRKLDLYGVVSPNFTNEDYDSYKRDVRVEFAYLPGYVQAQTDVRCGDDHWTQDPLFTWNNQATNYDMHDALLREAVASHEFGHTYGLNHNNSSGCNQNVAGLMYYKATDKAQLCAWAGPSIDDAYGASRIHSGRY